jgi:hypothetical protein
MPDACNQCYNGVKTQSTKNHQMINPYNKFELSIWIQSPKTQENVPSQFRW